MLFFYAVFIIFLLYDLPPLIKGKFIKETVIYSALTLTVGALAAVYYFIFAK